MPFTFKFVFDPQPALPEDGPTPNQRRITIYPTSPGTRPSRSFDLGGSAAVTEGGATWNVVDRPRRVGITNFAGLPPHKMAVKVMLDGFATDTSIEEDAAYLRDIERHLFGPWVWDIDPIRTVVFRIAGPLPLTNLRWVLESIEWDEPVRRDSDAQLVRQPATLHLLEFVDVDLIIETSPAQNAADRNAPFRIPIFG